jgi:hypothetical protein
MELAGRARAQGACSAHAFQPVRSARPPGNQGAPRGDMAAHSIHRWSSRGVGGPGGMSGPRAPHERNAAVLRLEGQHLGKATRRRTPTPSALNRAEIKEGGKGKRLRWCSRWGGGVAVAGSRTAMARRSRRSRRRTVPCSGPAPFSDANGLLSFPRAAVEGDVLGGSAAFLAA